MEKKRPPLMVADEEILAAIQWARETPVPCHDLSYAIGVKLCRIFDDRSRDVIINSEQNNKCKISRNPLNFNLFVYSGHEVNSMNTHTFVM